MTLPLCTLHNCLDWSTFSTIHAASEQGYASKGPLESDGLNVLNYSDLILEEPINILLEEQIQANSCYPLDTNLYSPTSFEANQSMIEDALKVIKNYLDYHKDDFLVYDMGTKKKFTSMTTISMMELHSRSDAINHQCAFLSLKFDHYLNGLPRRHILPNCFSKRQTVLIQFFFCNQLGTCEQTSLPVQLLQIDPS